MKLAIVADWLVTYGGAEHVLAEFLHIWPLCPLFTTVARPEALGPLRKEKIITSRLQTLYRLTGRHQILLPLMPRAIESLDLSGHDVILSSSHAIGKGIIPPGNAVHVCYCHTPMRYAWEMEEQYLDDFRIPRLLRGIVRTQLRRIRRWDLSTARRVDTFIANSTETQRRIATVYGRDSIVIHPPADDRFFEIPLSSVLIPKSHFLAVGRFVPYKRFDLLIAVANALKLPLMIAGRGQEESRLRAMAGPTVTFLGFVPDQDLPSLYAKSKAVLFAPHEDAGIVPLEAQASGTPVIAFGKGGALDTIKDGETGLFFESQTVESMTAAIKKFEGMTWEPEQIREHAKQFEAEKFRTRIREIVERTYGENSRSRRKNDRNSMPSQRP